MVNNISSKDMLILRKHLIKNLSGGSKTKKYLKGFGLFILFISPFVAVGVYILNQLESEPTPQDNEQNTDANTQTNTQTNTRTNTRTNTGNPGNNRETITVGVSESRTTRSSGNMRRSDTVSTGSVDSTRSVQERSCVDGVCS